MRQANRVWIVLIALVLCGSLSAAQSSTSTQDETKTSVQAQTSPGTSTSQTTTTTQTSPAGGAVTATIRTAGSPYKSRIKWLQPTLQGTSGLFNVFSAEGFRRGEWSLQLGVTNYDRDPGDIEFTDFPVTFSVGLGDRAEWALGWVAQRRIDPDDILSYQTPRGGPVRPMRIHNFPGNSPVAYYNGAPFVDVNFGEGISDLFSALKLNPMSEHRNNPFALALRGNVKMPTSRKQSALTAGRTTGEVDGGVELLLSKYAGPATFMLNTGVQFVGDPREVELQNEYRYGAGLAFGSHPVQLTFEANGTVWFGDKSAGFANPRSPVDLAVGLRLLPGKAFSIGAGYRYNARTWRGEPFGGQPTDHSGYFATLSFNRKINRPPTVECVIETATIQQRGRATVRATVNDPDDSDVNVTWRTTGGRLSGTGDSVTFETGDLTETAPGRYSITAEVSDGDNTATCSADVTVEKLKIAPKFVTCEPATQTIEAGQTATIRVQATDENPGDTLTYTWDVNGERASETGTNFTFGTTGRAPGRYTIRVTATDPDGLTATGEVNVEVTAPPPPQNRNPECELTLSKTEVNTCEALTVTARASDPDGDSLTYEWSLDGRTLTDKTGPEISIDTCGLAGGSHSVSLRITDSKGGSNTCTASFTVRARVVIELARLRIDNAAKARLDDVALQLQNDPRLSVVITGYDEAERENVAQRNGLRIAQLAKSYLVRTHKIDASRIEVKSGGKSSPRRIELEMMTR